MRLRTMVMTWLLVASAMLGISLSMGCRLVGLSASHTESEEGSATECTIEEAEVSAEVVGAAVGAAVNAAAGDELEAAAAVVEEVLEAVTNEPPPEDAPPAVQPAVP